MIISITHLYVIKTDQRGTKDITIGGANNIRVKPIKKVVIVDSVKWFYLLTAKC